MKIGLIQSNYVPWRGYFDFIDDVHLFVFYDDSQYTKGDWRNRNRIKTGTGLRWLTTPVRRLSLGHSIDETPIDYSQKWQRRQLNLLRQWYQDSPFFEPICEELTVLLMTPQPSISALNVSLCRWIMDKLKIRTPIRMSTEFQLEGTKTARLVDLVKQGGGTVYLSGPSARAYLDEELFHEHGLGLEYKSYDYAPYPQLWGEFRGGVSILDLLLNLGPEARHYLKSRTPNHVVTGRGVPDARLRCSG
jgi:hypothetical protein